MTDISLILFDLNGVLYRYDRDVRIAHLAAVSGQAPEVIAAEIWASGFEDAGDAGAFDAAAYLHGFGARIGYDLPEADWVAAQQAAVTPIAETMRLLPGIRPGVTCAVLTNNNLLVARHFARVYPEVAALVGDRAFVSAAFGLRKPDPEVYRRCLGRLGVAPEASLFVDDSQANVAGARAAGLQGHDYTGPEAFEAALRGRRLLADAGAPRY
jgi:putative hydrolase of the HAD superfamily